MSVLEIKLLCPGFFSQEEPQPQKNCSISSHHKQTPLSLTVVISCSSECFLISASLMWKSEEELIPYLSWAVQMFYLHSCPGSPKATSATSVGLLGDRCLSVNHVCQKVWAKQPRVCPFEGFQIRSLKRLFIHTFIFLWVMILFLKINNFSASNELHEVVTPEKKITQTVLFYNQLNIKEKQLLRNAQLF